MYAPGSTEERVLQKLKHYCAYQERSHREAREKAYALGLRKTAVEALLARLIEEGYLNEERFAVQFALGKFRIKQWGRVKIAQELKLRQVSNYCIQKALQAIDERIYKATIRKLAESKSQRISAEKNLFIKKGKVRNYLLQKGYEISCIREVLQDL